MRLSHEERMKTQCRSLSQGKRSKRTARAHIRILLTYFPSNRARVEPHKGEILIISLFAVKMLPLAILHKEIVLFHHPSSLPPRTLLLSGEMNNSATGGTNKCESRSADFFTTMLSNREETFFCNYTTSRYSIASPTRENFSNKCIFGAQLNSRPFLLNFEKKKNQK